MKFYMDNDQTFYRSVPLQPEYNGHIRLQKYLGWSAPEDEDDPSGCAIWQDLGSASLPSESWTTVSLREAIGLVSQDAFITCDLQPGMENVCEIVAKVCEELGV